MKLLITGATGLTGGLFLKRLAKSSPQATVDCLVQPKSDRSNLTDLDLNLKYHLGDSSNSQTWDDLLAEDTPETIIHIASIRHINSILNSLEKAQQTPRLIVIGTTGIYSKYNDYSAIYKQMESRLGRYQGAYCLLRPTMIYGSPQDKNIHKLLKFSHKYGLFFVFGDGNSLFQPIHAGDIAQALLAILQNPQISGDYNISGGSVVTFKELLNIVGKQLGKPVRPVFIPFSLGLKAASWLEAILKLRSPVTKEQILRLQEDKAYPHDAAQQDFNFQPRSLEVGIQQEIELMRSQKII